MKKLLCVLLAVVLTLTFIGCTPELPDPQVALEEEIARLKSGDDQALSDELSASLDLPADVADSEAIRESILNAAKALLANSEFTVTDKQVDNKAGTAIVNMDVVTPDLTVVMTQFEEKAVARVSELYTEHGEDITPETLYVEIIDILTELINSPDTAKVTKPVVLNMTYDKEAGQWNIDNPEVINAIYQ